MSKKRITYTPEFKSKVALAAVRQELTVSEIAAKNKVHSVNVTKWKSQLLERMSGLFVDAGVKKTTGTTSCGRQILLRRYWQAFEWQ
ncbi:MAG: transposase [Planctomycetaceae bacterium]|jgi:transposase-like protein|nr:transposase [Planctomycetaceae bacterium]